MIKKEKEETIMGRKSEKRGKVKGLGRRTGGRKGGRKSGEEGKGGREKGIREKGVPRRRNEGREVRREGIIKKFKFKFKQTILAKPQRNRTLRAAHLWLRKTRYHIHLHDTQLVNRLSQIKK